LLIRIVDLYFDSSNEAFAEKALKEMAPNVASFSGCVYVEILKDNHQRGHFSTYSHWLDAADLEHYRQSDAFRIFWSSVKPYFSKPARAWSSTMVEKAP